MLPGPQPHSPGTHISRVCWQLLNASSYVLLPGAFLQPWKQAWPSDKREARNSREEVPLEELSDPSPWMMVEKPLTCLASGARAFWDTFTVRLSPHCPTAATCFLAHPAGGFLPFWVSLAHAFTCASQNHLLSRLLVLNPSKATSWGSKPKQWKMG